MQNNIGPILKLNKILSSLFLAIGIFLIIYMVTIEGELGALPLFLAIGGAAWFMITRYKIKNLIAKK